LTASVLPHERAAALTAGCDAFLDKPYAAQDLLDALAAHLAKRRGSPQLPETL
jgi:two-component system, OmpR family, KDP operon response regulator KdpE